MDSASWALLLLITKQVQPLLIILSARPMNPEPPELIALRNVDSVMTTKLLLDVLSTDEVASLAEQCVGGGVAKRSYTICVDDSTRQPVFHSGGARPSAP